MREIKFRAWDKESKTMIQSSELSFHEYVTIAEQFADDDKVFMQYIGIKDKNGKEIYEDDIVKLVHRKSEKGGWYSNKLEVGRVFFDLKWGAKFNCKDHTQRVSQHWKSELDCFSDATDVLVIGNIYENSKVLKIKT